MAKGFNNADLDTKKEELGIWQVSQTFWYCRHCKKIKNLPLMDHCPESKDDPDDAEDGENAQYNGRYDDPAGP